MTSSRSIPCSEIGFSRWPLQAPAFGFVGRCRFIVRRLGTRRLLLVHTPEVEPDRRSQQGRLSRKEELQQFLHLLPASPARANTRARIDDRSGKNDQEGEREPSANA